MQSKNTADSFFQFLDKPLNSFQMKSLMKFSAMAFMALTLTMVGCDEDPDVPPVGQTNNDPTVELQNGAGVVVDSFAITGQDANGSFIGFTVIGDDIDDNLQTVSFERDGVLLDATSSSVRPDDITGVLTSNRTGVDSSGFTRTFFFQAPSDFDASTTYTITVTDVAQATASVDLTITTPVEIVTTPIQQSFETVLFSNQAGPAGTGGVDLDAGAGTGSMDMTAELRDLGIDTSLPDADNWRQQIAPANSMTILRAPSAAFVAENPFADVTTQEAIIEGFESSSVDINESQQVTPGSIFAVFSETNNRYYLVEVMNVIVTAADNSDRYVLNIKY